MGPFERARANLRQAYEVTRAAVRASRQLRRDRFVDREADDPADDPGGGAGRSGTGGGGAGRSGTARGGADRAELAPVTVPNGVHPSVTSRDDEEVPHALRIAAAWSWRLLLLGAALAVTLWLVGRLKHVLIPLSIALLLAALLAPAARFLRRRVRLPKSLAAAFVLVGGLAAVAGTLTLVITQFVDGYSELSAKASTGLSQIQTWLQEGPLNLSNRQFNDAIDAASNWLNANRDALTSGAVSTAAATIEFLAQLFLVLFATFFYLRDGHQIWRFAVRGLPTQAREQIASAGVAAWTTLVSYVRAIVLVAFIDALGIGVALYFLDVQFALPLAALVFLAAFVPIVGATVSGAVAVLIALVDEGPPIALIVLLVVIAVQQIEGHVLQPLIMGRAVAIHPLAVIVAIATGVMLAGIIGALVAVPIVAMLNTAIRHLAERRRTAPPPVSAPPVSAPPVSASPVSAAAVSAPPAATSTIAVPVAAPEPSRVSSTPATSSTSSTTSSTEE